MTARRLSVFALSASCVGCDPPAAIPTELGTGVLRFESLTDGEQLPIIFGPQGGYHVWVAVRVSDATLQRVTTTIAATFDADGRAVGPAAQTSVQLQTNGNFGDAVGLRAFIDMPADVMGQRIRIKLDTSTEDGRHGSDERVVVPQ